MGNDITKSKTGTQLQSSDTSSLTRQLVAEMSDEERRKHGGKALEALIEREISDTDMQRRHVAANVGIERDIETARQLNQAGSDFRLESDHRTASGHTKVVVTKNNNTMWIVVMVVIAVIFFVLFSR